MQSPVRLIPEGPQTLFVTSRPLKPKNEAAEAATLRWAPQSHNSGQSSMNKPGHWFPAIRFGKSHLCLTALAFAPYAVLRQSAGRPPFKNGGKSGLHTDTAPDNVRRGRPQGKRHRKQTAGSLAARPSSGKARVKGCGKSAPRGRQRRRHGKPRREQNRIGATRGALSAARPCPLALPLGLVARGARRRASQRNGRHVGAMSPGHTEPGLQAGWRLLRVSFKLGSSGPHLRMLGPSKPERQ